MALTPAEKLQVISTQRSAFIKSLQQQFLKDSDSLAGEYLEWDRSRGSDFRLGKTFFSICAKLDIINQVSRTNRVLSPFLGSNAEECRVDCQIGKVVE